MPGRHTSIGKAQEEGETAVAPGQLPDRGLQGLLPLLRCCCLCRTLLLRPRLTRTEKQPPCKPPPAADPPASSWGQRPPRPRCRCRQSRCCSMPAPSSPGSSGCCCHLQPRHRSRNHSREGDREQGKSKGSCGWMGWQGTHASCSWGCPRWSLPPKALSSCLLAPPPPVSFPLPPVSFPPLVRPLL